MCVFVFILSMLFGGIFALYFVVFFLHTFYFLTTVFKRADDFLILTKCFIDKKTIVSNSMVEGFFFSICLKWLLVIFHFRLAGVENHVLNGKYMSQRHTTREVQRACLGESKVPLLFKNILSQVFAVIFNTCLCALSRVRYDWKLTRWNFLKNCFGHEILKSLRIE